MVRVIMLAALALSVTPCAAQGIMAPPPGPPPVAPAAPATPQLSPSAHVPAPALPPLHDDLLKDLPALPDLGEFPPQAVSWIRLRAAGLARSGEIPDAEKMPSYVRKASRGIDFGGMAIEDAVILLFMLASNEAREELRSMMEEMQKTKAARERSEKGEPDEMESIQLQKLMERRSKILSTLSNLLKKRSTTADSIIGNNK